MTSKHFWSGVLIVVLSVVLAKPAKAAGNFPSIAPSKGAVVAAFAGVAAAVVIVAVVIIHKSSSKRTITGCVNSGEHGTSVIDDKDKHSYALFGNTTGIKPGNRMTLQGKKTKAKEAGKTLVWETKQVVKDFGVCQPLDSVLMRR